jgi:hypothetical protein
MKRGKTHLTASSLRSSLAPASIGGCSATFSAEKKGRVLVVIKTCLPNPPFFATPVGPTCDSLVKSVKATRVLRDSALLSQPNSYGLHYEGGGIDCQSRQAYIVGSAQIVGWDSALGRLAPGQVANGMCLDRAPLAVPVDQVCQVRVPRTIVHGRHVFPGKDRPV